MAKVVIVALCFLASVLAGPVESPPQRIIGGNITPVVVAPSQASIRRSNEHICGGAIVNDLIILTVAHCVSSQSTSYLTVVVGTNTLSSGGDINRVSNIILHPEYDAATRSNDVAVLKLKSSLRFSDSVQPIRLSMYEPYSTETLFLVGWGSRNWGSNSPSNMLQSVAVSNLDLDTCRRTAPAVRVGNICTSASNSVGLCNKDDGSLVINSRGRLVGVASRISCGNNIPDVHASVAFYYDWIIEKTYQ